MVVVLVVFGVIVCVCVVASDTFLGPTRHDCFRQFYKFVSIQTN